jgi:hypothetical protein
VVPYSVTRILILLCFGAGFDEEAAEVWEGHFLKWKGGKESGGGGGGCGGGRRQSGKGEVEGRGGGIRGRSGVYSVVLRGLSNE